MFQGKLGAEFGLILLVGLYEKKCVLLPPDANPMR
jgi:hypothetical protein